MSYNITSIKLKMPEKIIVDIEEFVALCLQEAVLGRKTENITISSKGDSDLNHEVTIECDLGTLVVLMEEGSPIRGTIVNIYQPEYTPDYSIVDYLKNYVIDNKLSLEMIIVWEGGDAINQIKITKGILEETES